MSLNQVQNKTTTISAYKNRDLSENFYARLRSSSSAQDTARLKSSYTKAV